MKKTVFLIEDDKLMRVTLEDALRAAGYEVASFDAGTPALHAFKDAPCDIVITDVRLPDLDGLDVLKEVTETSRVQVIIMTAFGTIKDAVEAMKLGAFDYITKPFSLDEFLLIIERALEVQRLREENIRLKRDISRCYRSPNIIGESEAMKRVLSLIDRVAAADSTVLILGESGTGKELVATTIHYQSARKDGPLIKVNCAALPEGLIESELFGHEKGAFTGAIRRKPGRFELAGGGTIFLDEVGDLPPAAQSKLLRVLQEKSVERIGGTETVTVDVRVIAATNKNLEEEVKSGRFREDLYYRLNVIPVTIPPLRERREDIPYLIDHFMNQCKSRRRSPVRFSKDALDALMSYDYPGNIRELENILERCITLSASDTIGKEDLPAPLVKGAHPQRRLALSAVTAGAEKEHISRVLREAGGNRTRAAEMLGISRKTLWEKMNAYELS